MVRLMLDGLVNIVKTVLMFHIDYTGGDRKEAL